MDMADAWTILVVEDDPDLLELLLLALPKLGRIRAVGAPTGQAGITQSVNLHPDCIVVDLRDASSTYSLVRALRRSRETATTPLIALVTLPQDLAMFDKLGWRPERVFIKPLYPSQLVEHILQLIVAPLHATPPSAALEPQEGWED